MDIFTRQDTGSVSNRNLSRDKPIQCFKAMRLFRTYGWKQYRNVFLLYKLTFSITDCQYLADISKTSKNKTCLFPAITSRIQTCSYHSKKITVTLQRITDEASQE